MTEDLPARRRRTASSAGSPFWIRCLLAAMVATVSVYVIDIAFHAFTPDTSERLRQFASYSIFYGAAILCLMKGRVLPAERSAWRLLALAMTLWGTGGLYYALFLWNSAEVPVPSVADAFWLAFYPVVFWALYLLLKQRIGHIARGVKLDALVGALGVGGAGSAVVFGELLSHTSGFSLATLTNLSYPVADLGMLALVVAAITVMGWRASGVWRWIGSAIVIFVVTDSIYLIQVAQGVYTGGLLDLGWPAAALLVGFAAVKAGPAVTSGARTRTTLLMPVAFGSAALALLVVDHFVRTNVLALGLATASMLVILVRLYLTAQDNAQMLTLSRREAATDALTGLGNRRRLMADLPAYLEELTPERPLMLTLYDLDGFKHYNDTFGHLAGDQLLERLSARLSETVAGQGAAYRMGGDEFCTLWYLTDGDQAAAYTADAVTALSEEGEAFTIGCSHGSVLLPDETTDSTEALRIADRRMYVRKGSGRASAGRQSSDVLLRALAERDADLGLHLDDVAELVSATARLLGVGDEDMDAARHTALLHDVGKFAIPDEILSKPGPLDDAEWEFMKRHTIIGERIILAAPALTRVARFVRSTHERFDGGGYPDGLAGDGIPLISRIVTVCDAYDAMVTTRSYREARDSASAVAELRRCSGTQFDPAVVDAFAQTLETQDAEAGISAAARVHQPA